MSKTANNTHPRALRAVTPVTRAGRMGAGAALAAAMLLGGGAAATAEPQADAPAAPQADAAPALLAPVIAPSVGIPAAEAADGEAEPAFAPTSAALSVEVPEPEPEPEPAPEEETSESTQGAEGEQDSQDGQQSETRQDEDTSSRSEERTGTEDDGAQQESTEDVSAQQQSSGAESEPQQVEEQEEAAPAPSAGKGSSVLSTARSGVGTPYVYGGTSPSGWDCSGFVQWVYAQHGVNLPRGAAGQAAAGTVIPRSEAQPGDLVYKPGHIGIYAGGNTFVDAGNSRVDTSERNIYSGSWTFIRVG